MNGPSVVRSRQRRFLGRKPLTRCQNRVEEENVVLIDEETDNSENVIVIDITESLPTKFGGETDCLRTGKKAATSCPGVVICLDDDDEDMDDQVDGDCEMNEGNAKNGCSSSRKSNTPTSANFGRSSAAKIDGCLFDQENVSPLKLSKGKRTYSGKTYTGNRFGVYDVDVDDLSCDDIPDCELMEDPCGSVKEMWEKAYTKRKWDSQNDQPDLDDSNKGTYDARQNVKTSTDCGQCEEPPPVSKQAEHEGEAFSIHNNKGNSHYNADESLSASAHDGVKDFVLDSNLYSRFSYTKRKWSSQNGQPNLGDSNKDTYDSCENAKTSTNCGMWEEPPPVTKQAEHEGEAFSFHNNKGNSHYTADESLSASAHDGVEDFVLDSNLNSRFSYTKRRWNSQNGQPDLGDSKKDGYDSCKNAKTSADCGQREEPPPVTKQAEHEGEAFSIHKNKGNSHYTADETLSSSAHDKVEDFVLDSNLNSRFSNGKNDTHYTRRSRFEFDEYRRSHFSEPSSLDMKSMEEQKLKEPSSFSTVQNGSFPEKTCRPTLQKEPKCMNNSHELKSSYKEASFSNTSSAHLHTANDCTQYGNKDKTVTPETFCEKNSVSMDKMNIRKDSFQFNMEHLNGWSSIFHSYRNDVHSPNSPNQQDDQTNDSMHGQDDDTVHSNESVMVSDREKLKETEEYKKATEEEWASRQRTLQIQAEEAQNLRRIQKRRKAETMRILDMEKRQKQRLVEIRETEKKDQENSNLREIIRAGVIRDLNKLEVTCRDMASLLRALGIPIGGGLHPPSLSEVRAAYKRAVLAFHPDRASRSDMRLQVEAEEKFKLIFRMKEKYLPSL